MAIAPTKSRVPKTHGHKKSTASKVWNLKKRLTVLRHCLRRLIL